MVGCYRAEPCFSRIWYTTFFIHYQFLWCCGWMEENMRLLTVFLCLRRARLEELHIHSLLWGAAVSVSEQSQTHPTLKSNRIRKNISDIKKIFLFHQFHFSVWLRILQLWGHNWRLVVFHIISTAQYYSFVSFGGYYHRREPFTNNLGCLGKWYSQFTPLMDWACFSSSDEVVSTSYTTLLWWILSGLCVMRYELQIVVS